MMKKFTIVLTCIMALSLVACSGTSDEEKALLPFPLPKFTPSLDIKPSWKVSTSAEVEGVFSRLQPGMAYGKVYVAGTNGEVEARNLEDGKLVWKKKMDVIIESGVAVADRIVVVGSQEGEVIALDAETGEELWRNLVSSEIISPAA
ncbi:MAG: outer membrane protein assembly factor BamB, partial [Gammaproteobacteria bacterium CG22_combo_CG10-13_8_21_14_all_40_8]